MTYPLQTRFDQFVPLSAGELADRIASKGFNAVDQYLDGFGGLTSLFNTWVRSTASANGLAVAGSINVVSFTNVAAVHCPHRRADQPGSLLPARPASSLKPGDPGYDPNYTPEDQ